MNSFKENPQVITLETAGTYPYHIIGRVRLSRRTVYYKEGGILVEPKSYSLIVSKCILCGVTTQAEGPKGGECFGWHSIDKVFNKIEGDNNGPTSSV